MNDLIPGSSCALNDRGCICANKQLIEDLSACVTAACTIRETLGAFHWKRARLLCAND